MHVAVGGDCGNVGDVSGDRVVLMLVEELDQQRSRRQRAMGLHWAAMFSTSSA